MVYSPLEQFEPVSFFSIFIGNINLSLTNISLLFIFIMLVFSFLVNGYFFYFQNTKNTFNFNINSSKNYQVQSVNSSVDFEVNNVVTSSNNNIVYLNNLVSRSSILNNFSSYKASKINSFETLNNKFSNLFLKLFFNLLRSKNFEIEKSRFLMLACYFNDLVSASKKNNKSTLFQFFNSLNKEKGFKRLFVPTVLIFIFESIFQFILDQVKAGIEGDNKTSVKFFPVIFLLFNFILLANLLGLIPYSSTVTAYIIITLTLAMMVWLGSTITAFKEHGLHFFSFFLPAGVPLPLWPLLITIELISYFIRVISLSVRLFVNMMAGHTLLAVLAGFGWGMANAGIMLFIVHPLPIGVVFVLVGLELAVACVQAFVFALLSCIYISDAINLH